MNKTKIISVSIPTEIWNTLKEIREKQRLDPLTHEYLNISKVCASALKKELVNYGYKPETD